MDINEVIDTYASPCRRGYFLARENLAPEALAVIEAAWGRNSYVVRGDTAGWDVTDEIMQIRGNE